MTTFQDLVAGAVISELERARKKHGPMRSAHEGYAVIKEEFEEAWDAIKADDIASAREEMIQVAAMAMRFLLEVGVPSAPGGNAPDPIRGGVIT